MNILLHIEELSLRIGGFNLGPLSLKLEQGDYLVLLGPSGCGKTSLLRTIAGVYNAPDGSLRLAGRDVGTLAPHRRGIGYVAQTADLFPHMDVARNIMFGLRYARFGAREQHRIFERITGLLQLESLLHRLPPTLSGGESKRAALARSLAVSPRILLLDEPLGMLDYNARAGMLETLQMIHKELGTATIHVTHDREEAWTLGGHCAVMRAGRIEQIGTVEKLFRRPETRFTAEFLNGANIFPARFDRHAPHGRASLDWAEFALDTPVDFETGYVQILPENLVPVSGAGAGRIAAVVRAKADRGIYTELKVEAHNGPLLRVHLTAPENRNPRIGDTLWLECRTAPHPIPEGQT